MYSLILSVVAVFVLCEATNVVKRNKECGELMRCMRPLNSFIASNVGSVSALAADEQYDQLCQANTDFQSCYAAKNELCNNPAAISTFSGLALILEYICSDDGKEELEKIADSPCVTDPSALLVTQKSMEECIQSFQLEFDMAFYSALSVGEDASSVNVCSFVDQLNNCIMASLTNQCGNKFVSFATKLSDIALKPVAKQIRCDRLLRHIRHLNTLIFPLVLAAAKKRR